MAKHTEVRLIDDMDGTDADETLDFGLDGKIYEIDLNEKHAGIVRDFLAQYVDKARLSGRTVKAKSVRSTGGPRGREDREEAKVMREWAEQRGMKVSARGRIPSNVREAYEQAHA